MVKDESLTEIGVLGFSNPLLALLGYLAGERLSSVVGEEFLEADLRFDRPQGRRFRSDTRSAATPPSAGRVKEWRLGPGSWFPPPATSNRT
jgi:hypothetical protein